MRPDIDACPFCQRIVADEVDGRMWSKYNEVAHFEPLNPVTPGHRLFVPTIHVRHSEDGAYDRVGSAFEAAHRWAYENQLYPQFNLITSVGSNASQTIDHVHIHLVPRTREDGLVLPWTNQIKES